MINSLSIAGLRNIREARLDGLGARNVFYGVNGSGKTSVLEAVHLLSTTRSFRSRKLDTVIQQGLDRLVVFAELSKNEGSAHRLGVERRLDGDRKVRLDGENMRGFGDLAQLLPVQLINAESFQLLEGSPVIRRQLIDWGLFHVKHQGFFQCWKRYNRALKQRNALLKQAAKPDVLAPWDRELADAGTQLHGIRKDFAEVFSQQFNLVYKRLISTLGDTRAAGVSIAYAAGWDTKLSLVERLAAGAEVDRGLGYTRAGPHRADIKIKLDGKPAAEVLSRGQVKTVVCALKIALGALLSENAASKTVYLVDDLPAELDAEHREVLWSMFDALGAQLLVTGISAQDFCDLPGETEMFHVKHGAIERQ